MTPDEQARRERLVASTAGEWMDDPAERDPETCGTQVLRYDEDDVLAFAASEVRRALDELAKPVERSAELENAEIWLRNLTRREEHGSFEYIQRKVCIIADEMLRLRDALALAEQENAALRHQLERYQHGCTMLAERATEALQTIHELRAVEKAAIDAIDGEMTVDCVPEGGSIIVETCRQFTEATRLLPEDALDPEFGTLPESVRKLVDAWNGQNALTEDVEELRAEVERKDAALQAIIRHHETLASQALRVTAIRRMFELARDALLPVAPEPSKPEDRT